MLENQKEFELLDNQTTYVHTRKSIIKELKQTKILKATYRINEYVIFEIGIICYVLQNICMNLKTFK